MVDLEGTLVLDGVATPYADDSSIANVGFRFASA
jgi:hypothetical protein